MILSLALSELIANNDEDLLVSSTRAHFFLDEKPLLALDMSRRTSNLGLVSEVNYFRFAMPCCGAQATREGPTVTFSDCPQAHRHPDPRQARELKVSFGSQGMFYNGKLLRRFLAYYLSHSHPKLHSVEVALLGEEIILGLEQCLTASPMEEGPWALSTDFLGARDAS